MLVLYPDIKPYHRQHLKVSPPHEIYVEESGNPRGIPVLFVHGGPGSGCTPQHRRFFDPQKYRIILFDQRGAGKSTPHAELMNNDTQSLLDDIEVIRRTLKIKSWVLFGGSWGSTLSLLYAEKHPEHVLGMILRGIFLCRKNEIDWLYRHGASLVFPDYWEDFIAPIPEAERDDLLAAYYKRLVSNNELARMAAAKAWCLWEARCSTLRPSASSVEFFSQPHLALAMARIEAHFFAHRGFLEPNQILREASRLNGIPGTIVHGRYDMICPLDNAFELSKVWHDASLNIVRDAGHSATEPGTVDALIRATRDMSMRYADDYSV
ncbi:MAG: prolyl aminopeptidase [Pseudomonadales bacterium]